MATAFERGTVPRTCGPVYRPNIHPTAVANERLPTQKSEAPDRLYDFADPFARAAADKHYGQAARCKYTGGYGTAGRFLVQGGAAGEGHQSYIRQCQTAGAQMQNIRSWPVKKSQVRCVPYYPVDVGRLQHRTGFGGHGGQGADALYDIPSACFEGAYVVKYGQPTTCMGSMVSMKGHRFDL